MQQKNVKIQVVSDLHLEFGAIEIPNAGDTDVLILAGDICVVETFRRKPNPRSNMVIRERYNDMAKFFEQVNRDFKHVLYVMGNHEHYHGDFATSYQDLKTALEPYHNIKLLDIETVYIEGVRFIGGTLWTNFNNEDPMAMQNARWGMNDYRIIKNDTATFLPEDSVTYHKAMIKHITDEVDANPLMPTVVIGHHAPSAMSVDGRYKGNALNDAYYTRLEEFIMARPCIKLWCHGHMHSTNDYLVGTTRVLANPRGYYGYEENMAFNPKLQVQV